MLYINVLLAWTSLILAFLISVIWIIRLLLKNKILKSDTGIARIYGKLKKNHKFIAVMFIIVSLEHGLLSTFPLLSLNWGTGILVLTVIMGAVIIFRTKTNKRVWANIHRVLAMVFIVMVVLHLVEVDGFPGTREILYNIEAAVAKDNATELSLDIDSDIVKEAKEEIIVRITPEVKDDSVQSNAPDTMPEATADLPFIDGIYIGIAEAYGPEMTLQVTIENSQIVDIVVISHNEQKSMFYERAFDTIIPDIINSKTTEVDSLTGSTYTSVGIKNAVRDALRQALGTGYVPEDDELPELMGHGGMGSRG